MRLYLHDEANAIRFKVQGDLAGICVTELENAWRTACSILRGKALLLDITQVTLIDEAGGELLGWMLREGAQLIPGARWEGWLLQRSQESGRR